MIEKKSKTGILLIACIAFVVGSTAYAATYDHEITVQRMTFSWRVTGDDLHIKLTAPTTGWVGIGFNPSQGMKDAKIILGYVKEGKVTVSDEFGTGMIRHAPVEKLGGKTDITGVSGKEASGETTIAFTIPLVARDTINGRIDPAAETVVLLAYGLDHDTGLLRHNFRTTIGIHLSTGMSDALMSHRQ